ncbi:MAG: VOC family protein [Gracilibacteraceae bacterium]|jgi:methylmalonyl-CoA/ethylmalonyl-CoA epimerase|nr:VOC family protein [Gracilibacteraceae bacterium]
MRAKLDRVAIVVSDVKKAKEDFEKLLGVEFYGPFDDAGPGLAVALPRRGGLELFAPTRENDAIGATRTLAAKGEGISGIALRVDDIEEAERHFAALGLKPDVKINHGGMKELIFMAQPATHGVEIAVNEYPEANGLALEVAKDLGVGAL